MSSGNIATRTFLGLGTAAAILFSGFSSLAEEETSAPAASSEEKVLVIVNGEKLTEKMALEQMQMRMPPNAKMRPAQREMMYRRFIPRIKAEFVAHVLLKEAAKREGVKVDEAEIDKVIEEYRANSPEGKTFDEAMAEVNMTVEKMREKIRDNLSIPLILKAKVGDSFPVSEEAIAKYYSTNKRTFATPETVHARHILIKFEKEEDAAGKAAKKAKAIELREKLLAGADFAELARENSDCPTKAKGGDLAPFTRGRMVAPFENAAFSQKVDEIGEILETKYGYHIIQVLEHTQATEKSLAEVKDQIAKDLEKKLRGEAVLKYLESLKKTAKIEYPDSPDGATEPDAPESTEPKDDETK